MAERHVKEVPDYTRAALVMAAINLFMFLAILWATMGFFISLLTAAMVDWVIGRVGDARRIRATRREDAL